MHVGFQFKKISMIVLSNSPEFTNTTINRLNTADILDKLMYGIIADLISPYNAN